VAGEGPDNEQNNLRTGEFVQIGTYGGWALGSRVKPGRVDWNLSIADNQSIEVPAWGGSMTAAWESIRTLGNAWLRLGYPAHRLAFGAILVQPVPDLTSGYTLISSCLPEVDILGDNVADFLYQINRPRESRVNVGSMTNRLSKWSVGQQGVVLMRISLGPASAPATANVERNNYAGRLELDINTAPTLAQDELQQVELVFSELMQLGQEIAEKGDIP